MVGMSNRQAAVLAKLVEWWQDLADRKINSCAILVPVPPQWGRTHLLNQFAAVVEDDEAVSIVVRVPGATLPDGLGLQALTLRELFSEASGKGGAGGGLGVSPVTGLVGLLLASVGVGAAGKVWDDSLGGQEGSVAKLARGFAAVSVSVPVIVIIDDADRLEADLSVILVENLIGRTNGRVLVVAAVNPDGELMSVLKSRAKYGLTEGRIRIVDAHPGMDYQARVDLVGELCPDLPAAAIRRIGQRTRTFADVFAITAAERLAGLDAHGDGAAGVTVADSVIDASVHRAPPSPLAVVLAWAGGVLHARQAERAVNVLDHGRHGDESDIVRLESVVRLEDPASPRVAEQVRCLATGTRHELAEVVLNTAVEIGESPKAGLVEKVVAWQAAHRVRADLRDRLSLLGVQCQLAHGLENLGDLAAASQVAATAIAEYLPREPDHQHVPEYADLSATLLRLAQTLELTPNDPLINAAVAAAASGGAAVWLEARIWTAIELLGQPGQRERALELTDQIAGQLSSRNDLGAIANQWRLLLAFHAGRAGYPAITQQLLAPMLTASSPPEDDDAARAVLRAVGGPWADTRLQIIMLEEELQALPHGADDDRLRIHHTLAVDYDSLGDYRRALYHREQELPLRRLIQGGSRRDMLRTHGNIASRIGQHGRPEEALRLFQELLADRERILGPDHPDTLATRSHIAGWTGQCGRPEEAQRLFQDLLADRERILGPDHPSTLATRSNIAFWTAQCRHREEALRLCEELLPHQERILGPDHPDTLRTRRAIQQLRTPGTRQVNKPR